MQFNRRQFLTGCGSILATLGILEGLESILDAPNQVAAAQTSPKKLALLVGLNQYQNRAKFPDLKGCVTDVALMQNLLIHRFGFKAQDIHILTNEAATRAAIELAFQTHLIDQAKSSDVVVFHFSGFGQYLLPQSSLEEKSLPLTQYGLLPYDAVVSQDKDSKPEPGINAILQETLYLLIQSLKTERVVTILDTGFHYPGTANLDHARVRSLPAGSIQSVNPAELRLQDELLSRNKIKRSQMTEQRLNTPPRGLVVTAAYHQQFGIEADWQGFSTGALTYALAQQVWHTAPNSSFAVQVSRAAEFIAQEFSLTQQPELVGQKKSTLTRDFMGLSTSVGGDGVIVAIDGKGKTGDVWLGGLIPALLKTDKTESILTVLSNQPNGGEDTLIRVGSRKGLQGNALTIAGGPLNVGDIVKERYRQISKNQPLRLALSHKLKKVEKVDATSAFSGNGSAIKVVNLDQAADVVLSKLERAVPVAVTDTDTESNEPSIPQTFYCLCTLAGDILPGTVSDRPEAVKNRVEALQESFNVLRWHQCLEQLINPNNSDLSASVALGTKTESGNKNILLAKSTIAAAKGLNTVPANAPAGQILTLDADTRFQLTLTNSSVDPLYCYIFGFDAHPNALMIYRSMTISDENGDRSVFKPFTLDPNSELVLPSDSDEFGLYGPAGLGSFYALLTHTPLTKLEKSIDQATKPANKGSLAKQIKIAEPLILREALLNDLGSLGHSDLNQDLLSDDKSWTLSLTSWAMMRFVYQIL